MSLKKIVESALDKNALELSEAFKEEMAKRVAAVLEAKVKATKESEEEDEDEDESEEDESEDEDEVEEKYKKK